MQDLEQFKALGLSDRTIQALKEKGFEIPTAIQAACIPLLLKEHLDVVGQAQTGTGKTAAFGLPILEIVQESKQSVQALILSPTRELAVQVADEIDSLKGDRPLEVLAVYGGASMDHQIRKLRSGVHVVVGTPGRLLDHIRRGTLDLHALQFVVLDEADEILNMGFIEDVEAILEQTPAEKRMLLFSATMPQQILTLAQQYMGEYQLVRIEQQHRTSDLTEQYWYEVREQDKTEALARIIDMAPDFYGLVFCRTKMQSDDVGRQLIERGYNAEVIHGDLAQKQRELILHKLREKRISILVATDVAARGIDVQDLTHVVNYTIPQNPDTYIHRIGRTGRAGKAGTAITLVTPSESRRFTYIRRSVKADIPKQLVPDANAIVAVKRARLLADITETLVATVPDDFLSMASEILENRNPEEVLGAMLHRQYGSQLDAGRYKPVALQENRTKPNPRQRNDERREWRNDRQDGPFRDDRGTRGQHTDNVRLFIAKGRSSGLTKRLLCDYIIEHARVDNHDLDAVEVLEDFSFVTAPYPVAQDILRAFSRMEQDGKPIITKARPDNPNGKHLVPGRKTSWNDHRRSDFPGDDSQRQYGRRPYAAEPRNSYQERKGRGRFGTGDSLPGNSEYARRDSYDEMRFERRERYSFPSDRPVPGYARTGEKVRYHEAKARGKAPKRH